MRLLLIHFCIFMRGYYIRYTGSQSTSFRTRKMQNYPFGAVCYSWLSPENSWKGIMHMTYILMRLAFFFLHSLDKLPSYLSRCSSLNVGIRLRLTKALKAPNVKLHVTPKIDGNWGLLESRSHENDQEKYNRMSGLFSSLHFNNIVLS